MKKLNQISDAELEVMKVLCKNGECTSSQIVEILTQSTDWKPKTIQTLIARLATKEDIDDLKQLLDEDK